MPHFLQRGIFFILKQPRQMTTGSASKRKLHFSESLFSLKRSLVVVCTAEEARKNRRNRLGPFRKYLAYAVPLAANKE